MMNYSADIFYKTIKELNENATDQKKRMLYNCWI